MAKEKLKNGIKDLQNGVCALTGQELPEETKLFDTDRKRPKAKGGIYLVENTRVVEPQAHMKRHGNWRVLPEHLRKLKEIIDDREQVRKLAMKVNNQILAYKRRVDSLSDVTLDFLLEQKGIFEKTLANRDKILVAEIKKIAKTDKLAQAALKVKGIGSVTIAYCLIYIDLEKARHASSLWSYTGIDKPSHSRYEKGVAGGGNKSLRTVLYTMADSQVKTKGAYREVYDHKKSRLEISEKITKSRNTEGKLIECAWKDTKPCHRHGAAMRAIMKHFLADYWFVGRTLAGLPTSALYPEAILGGTHRTIMPEERGWVY